MVDVDHFRAFNEEEGHDVGDEVLRQVADALRDCLRPYDMAARYGGEEFTVIFPGMGSDDVLAAAERIRARVEAIVVGTAAGRERHVTVSLGTATYPLNAGDAPTLLRAADVALYRAKRAGRNRVEAFDGLYAGESKEPGVPREALDAWLDEEHRQEAEARVRRMAPELDRLSRRLALSTSQRALLDAMAYVLPVHAAAVLDPDRRRRMEQAEEFRTLLPSLDALAERWDGGGPQGLVGDRIPLLARVLAVVACRDAGDEPDLQLGRFDPEILVLARELPQAA